MKFGLSINLQYVPSEYRAEQHVREIIQLAHAAERYGFDSIWVSQHYLSTLVSLQPIPLLARLAGETDRVRLGTHVLLLPLLNPVDVAENVSTLDIISGGRVILGVGLGYRSEELTAFGIEPRSRADRLREYIHALRLLWTNNVITFHGKYLNIESAPCSIRPLQQPNPPIWIGAISDPAIRRAAAIGDGWCALGDVSDDELQRQMHIYRAELARLNRPRDTTLSLFKETCIRTDRESAWHVAEPYLRRKYEEYNRWGHRTQFTWADLATQFLVGTPQECSQQLRRYAQMGFNHFIFRVHWVGMPHYEAMETVRMLGKEVLPRLKSS